ncbi:PAS domain S-box protein [Massilia sp. B-10]|nr:PAS domain S-box protein [Massilia sp. B-10]
MFRVRPTGPIDFVSDAIEDISGYPAALLTGSATERWSDIICPEDRRMQARTVQGAVVSGKPYQIEYRITDATGTERWVAEEGQPQRDEATGAAWIDGIITDISERKHNEMRIEGLLAEQSAILDNVMFGVMFVRAARGLGQPPLRGTVRLRCGRHERHVDRRRVPHPGRVRVGLGQVQYPALALDKDFSEERQYRRRDGSLFWCLVSGRALDPLHPNEGSIWVYADVTERRLAEEKLRLSATVLEHIADGVMVIGTARQIVAINPAFTQITGYTEAEALGQDATLTRSARQDDAFYTGLWRELAETGFWRGEAWHQRKNGELYLEWLTVSAVRRRLNA